MKKIPHSFLLIFLLNIAVFLILQGFGTLSFFDRIGNIVNDSFTYKIQYTQNRHKDDIVIVKIDDVTLDSLGKSDLGMTAFDKGVYADFIEKIFTQYDAAVLGIDVIFANPSVLGAQDEQKLAQALKKYDTQVVIATRSDYTPIPLCLYSEAQHGAIDIKKEEKLRTFQLSPLNYDLSTYCPNSKIYEGNKTEISLFSREVLDLYVQKTNPFDQVKIQNSLKRFDVQKSDTAYIEYYSDGKTHTGTLGYESYSFIDIYRGLSKDATGKNIDLNGKIVLLGEVGTLMHDSHLTPIHQSIKMPGVEINANIINTLQAGRILQDANGAAHFFLFFCIQLLVIGSVFYFRIVGSTIFLLISILFVIGFGGWMFILGYIYDIFGGIIGCILSFIFAYIYRFQVTDKSKRLLKKQFALYVSPDIVEDISKHPEAVQMKGEKREMSIFFSDIVSFTDISESVDPEKMVVLLNEYFSEMTKIIHHNKGTLDKYIGDSVMCFFNAPLSQENHTFYACMTALEQQSKLKELNQKWKKEGYPEIKIRIGLHTGQAVHGNIGGMDTRVSYTIIGDSVNLASRLEGVCKEYGVYICASETVYELQKEFFHFRELDTISVKGKKQAVKIYQLIAPKSIKIPQQNEEYFQNYAEGLKYYRAGDYRKAGEIWIKNKNDPTSSHMVQRCRDVLDGKVQVEQGVFIMTHK